MSSLPARVCCVVVCYRPDAERLRTLCATLTSGDARVVLVDNTERPTLQAADLPTGCTLITLGRNAGIAHAQNMGIEAAGDADAIAFFDQDSQVPAGMLATLVAQLRLGRPDIVAPACVDDASGAELPSTRVDARGRATAVYSLGGRDPVDVDIVISSGSVATREVFALAGGLDASLFIDFVDTEWCLRCRAEGVPMRVIPQAVMPHRIGSAAVQVAGRTVSIHSPLRCYYQVRNSFLLLRMKHVPLAYGLAQLVSTLGNRALLLSIVKNRWTYLEACAAGLFDGILGRSGPRQA
ncbi:glycosyltransferase family 2 protein [Ramlibacter sp.]|uniref:glycosyltransferase family 2 protein n=1 Tax=Ramlibacter sp. TaxID=1917967 RepID=UPI003D0F9164